MQECSRTRMINHWPPNYTEIYMERQRRLIKCEADPVMQKGCMAYYKDRPAEFINDWGITYDPRNMFNDLPALLPFVLFKRQWELIDFFYHCLEVQESGLVEKTRDFGATWVGVGFSVWMFLFQKGASIGWGSRKEQLVDKLGDPDSIFEKIRMFLDHLPAWLRPENFDNKKHCSFMKIVNPENGSTITGEAGDNIGRGGRKTLYFKDEAAHYERPEKIEAALSANTNVQIDFSSVNGPGNVFYRRRQSGILYESPKQAETIEKGRVRVFIADWRDDPRKDQAWYNAKREKAEREGLLHIFKQEVDRDYTSAQEGVLIPGYLVKSAIDAHLKLNFEPIGEHRAGFDPYDEGADCHALVGLKGSVFTFAEKWHQGDTGQATRKVIRLCKEHSVNRLQYDAIGVGAGVKAESNRLKESTSLNGLKIIPWKSSKSPQDPGKPIFAVDDKDNLEESPPKNKDFFKNLKAQAYWNLRTRFINTFNAITKGAVFEQDELISIPSNLNNLSQFESELSQPTYKEDTQGRVVIDKTPPGTKSPNMADAAVMAFFRIKKIDPLGIQLGMPVGFKTERLMQ